MTETRRSSEVRKGELTDAALHIIATQGIASLSTRALADQVGLTTGAIFRHFESLDALLDAVVCRVEAVLDSTFPPADISPSERLFHFVEARSSAVGNQLGILRLVLSEQFLLALPKDGSARLSRCVMKTRVFLRECIQEAQQTGEIRSDVDAGGLAAVVMGTIQILALSAAHPGHQAVDAAQVRQVLARLIQVPVKSRAQSQKKS